MKEKTKYIFSINTGRSGSNYLSNIFNHVLGCRSFHEPMPIGNGSVMYRYSQGDLESMRKFSQEKAKIINELKGDDQVYVETNHCFIKGFGWFIPQYLPEETIGVIIIKRDKSKISESFLRINSSPLDKLGREWISRPNMKDPLVTPPRRLISPGATYQCARFIKSFLLRLPRFFVRKILRKEFKYPQWLINYELECLEWYVDETNAKAEAFKKKYPKIKYYETSLENLNSLESIQQMLTYFGCSGKESLIDIIGNPTNLKQPESKTT